MVHPGQHRRHGTQQILRLVDVAVGPINRQGLGHLGNIVPADGVAVGQLWHDGLDLGKVFVALVLLQRGNELFHLGEGLLVVDGEQHPRLDEHQVGRHGDKLARHLQIQPLALIHPLQILV